MASIFGLDQLFGQGRIGLGQTIAIVEFEQYAPSDFAAFESCYGLSSPIRNVVVDGGPGGPPAGQGEAALDTELTSFNAPAASLVVYEAPNNNDAQALDMFNRIAGDDTAQVVTTSWGNCEALTAGGTLQAENTIFSRMAVQGQTMIAASGDSGSEDCNPVNGSLSLGVDDPGSQPTVVSVGGTTLSSASASSQVVWNCRVALPGLPGSGRWRLLPAVDAQPRPTAARRLPRREHQSVRQWRGDGLPLRAGHLVPLRPGARVGGRVLPGLLGRRSAAPASPRRPMPGSSPTPTRAASTGSAGSDRPSTG